MADDEAVFELDPAGLYALVVAVVENYGPFQFTTEDLKAISEGPKKHLFFTPDDTDENKFLLGAGNVVVDND